MGNYYSKISEDLTSFKYGWKRELPDFRDYKYNPFFLDTYCDKIDLRNKCPGIYNQGKLGSCTANAIAGAYEYTEIKEKENNIFIPSRLFIYFCFIWSNS